MTHDFTRTVEAPDSVTAQEAVKALARSDGYRVRTVKGVRMVRPAAPDACRPSPSYTVTLAVEPRALVPEGVCE